MDYKTQGINKIVIAVIFLIVVSSASAQRCAINKIDVKPFYFSQSGLISEMYEKIKINDSNNYQIMLINFLSQVNKKEAFYISIDSSKKFNVIGLTADSVLFSGCINTTKKYKSDFVFNSSMPSGFLISECSNVISSHKRSIMLVFNHSQNKWVEYTSMDGYIREALTENKEYAYLKSCYELLEIVFKDLNFTIR